MIRSVLILLLLFKSFTTYGQVTLISANTDISVYFGIDNPIRVVNEKYPCKSIVLLTDNGKIQSLPNCEFFWQPKVIGGGTISAYGITGKDSVLLGSKTYNVKEITFAFRLYPAKNGKLSLCELFTLKTPIITYDAPGHLNMTGVVCKSYSITASRDGKTLFSTQNSGNEFSPETTDLFKTLKPGDILTFYNIFCNLEGKLDPVEYTMIE